MKVRALSLGLVLLCIVAFASPALTQKATDPLTGTWKGDWGPSATDRNSVVLELKWDGKILTGTVNPGPDAIAIENASFDPKEMKIHFEVNLTARNRRYAVDGLVEKDKMTGRWSRSGRSGDFQLVRANSKEDEALASDRPKLTGLGADERRILEYLLDDWGKDFSVTSIDLAMRALRIRSSDELRFRVGSYIKEHPELHATLRRWGWQTLVLPPDEKLVARAIVNRQRDRQPLPSIAEIARLVGISQKQTKAALAMLERYHILKPDKSAGGVGYVATESRYLNWQPWLDFQFHTVALSDGRIFNTN